MSNAIGIEDPFAINYSLNAQIVLNPEKFKFNKQGDFYIYEVNKNNFYYAGDNGFVIRRKDFLESGGYTQDIDNFMRMAKSDKKYKIAVPNNIRLYHKTSTGLMHMIKKRSFYVGHYLLKNFGARDFYWFNLKKNSLGQNLRFLYAVAYNLLILPAFLKSLEMMAKERKSYWIVHSFALFAITLAYIKSLFYYKIFKKQKEEKI